jgi:hypothetical protein
MYDAVEKPFQLLITRGYLGRVFILYGTGLQFPGTVNLANASLIFTATSSAVVESYLDVASKALESR